MTDTIFFRLLDGVNRPSRLSEAVEELCEGGGAADVYLANPSSFRQVPDSLFAYAVSERVRSKFVELSPVERNRIRVRHGAASKDDFRFLRLHFEVAPETMGGSKRWIPFAKGGRFARYYEDIELLINWENEASEIRQYVASRYPYLKGNTDWVLHPENPYGRPGITFPRRPHKRGSFRILPGGCIFADNGPVVFADEGDLFALLAGLNSTPFNSLVMLQMGRGTSDGGQTLTYEVGLIARTPMPELNDKTWQARAEASFYIRRSLDSVHETSHAFTLPALLQVEAAMVEGRLGKWQEQVSDKEEQLTKYQREIDDIAFRLYGIGGSDRQTEI